MKQFFDEITNNNYQMTNKFQLPKYKIPNSLNNNIMGNI